MTGRNRTREAVRDTDPAETLRDDLHSVADDWDDLQTAAVHPVKGPPGERVDATPDHDLRVGWTALDLIRRVESDIWFALRVLADETSGPLPVNKPTVEQLRYLADWRAPWLARHPDIGAAICTDWAKTALDVQRAARPERRRRIDVGVPCPEHATSDLGERIPCPGGLGVTIGPATDLMPDLVCDHDDTHRISPEEWLRAARRGHYDLTRIARVLRERRA